MQQFRKMFDLEKENRDHKLFYKREGKEVTKLNITAPRKSLGPILSNADETNAQRELKKIKVSIVEKDKQLAYFQQQLALTQSRVSELELSEDRLRRSEHVSKRMLNEKEANAKRQDVLLKHVHDRLSLFARKEENKIRRSVAAKQEIQEELERVGMFSCAFNISSYYVLDIYYKI